MQHHGDYSSGAEPASGAGSAVKDRVEHSRSLLSYRRDPRRAPAASPDQRRATIQKCSPGSSKGRPGVDGRCRANPHGLEEATIC
ncbi:uncharacterized protein STAUR_2252 [Stigmatella aurantiaca DW4/3-1]|uniref:Uncharacterized protein n=1 Tax=Stigmatella aurantiaca (strain DW4/3-1) TaxID=378806 RepID=E3FCD3_STIAD|nr:uncharacterized protein STAUR_2252 [Stigmatella aurantiaca DW4/3-1]